MTSSLAPTPSFIRPADRIADFKSYFFADLNKVIAGLRASGVNIIRLDIGSPDLAPPDFIREHLINRVRRSDTHGYTAYGGTPQYHEAVAEYYGKRFGVELTPVKETLALLGSKEGLFELSLCLLNPGDVALIPDPGYPTYSAGAYVAGAEMVMMPLLRENNFLPDLEAIPAEIARRAKVLWLNYPNNPTGAVAPLSFFERVVDFAVKNQIVIAHDAPYVDICFDGYKAPSIMQVPGAKEVAVEFNSLSKTYSMAGWRLGMAVGNEKIIGYLHTYKSQADTSHFGPILEAGALALTSDQSWIDERNLIYKERRDHVVTGLREAGFSVEQPPAAIYVWAKLPQSVNYSSEEFCSQLLRATGVSITPGTVYGKFGEGYVRVSLCTPAELTEQAMHRLVEWMKKEKYN